MSETTNNVVEMTAEKPYTLRRLEAKDVALMVSIVTKIGMDEVRKLLMSDDVQKLVNDLISDKKNVNPEIVGGGVALEAANVVMSNYGKCESDIFQFLANLSGKPKKSIESLPFDTFFEMIIDVIKKEEFRDFIRVVSKLFK